MLEKYLVHKIRTLLEKEYHANVIKHHGNYYSQAGVSDLICSVPCKIMKHAHPVYIEVKVPGEYPTKLQQVFLDTVRKTGAIAFVARSVDDVKTQMDWLMLNCG